MKAYIILLLMIIPQLGWAKLKVVSTTSDIQALVDVVGGDLIESSSIARGNQDPHYIEAKPSYMVKMRDADLLVANGLSLEVGWLPSLLRGARNTKLRPGYPGYLDLGTFVQPIGVVKGNLSRAMGDVHPDGNPHYVLDPVRLGELAVVVATRLAELDPQNGNTFRSRGDAYKKMMDGKVADWQKRIQQSGVTKIITYHSSMDYFADRFKLTIPIYIEPKPGIPPSAQHILEVVKTANAQKVQRALVDNFYDIKIAERIAQEVPGLKVSSVGIAVDSTPQLKTAVDVIEQLVKTVEGSYGSH